MENCCSLLHHHIVLCFVAFLPIQKLNYHLQTQLSAALAYSRKFNIVCGLCMFCCSRFSLPTPHSSFSFRKKLHERKNMKIKLFNWIIFSFYSNLCGSFSDEKRHYFLRHGDAGLVRGIQTTVKLLEKRSSVIHFMKSCPKM